MDPDTRRLMMFAGGLGVVLVSLISASALMGRHTGEVPVVSADPRPIREKPVNPGGMKVDGAENDVFSGGTDTSNARLAPASEVPNTKALRASADASNAPPTASTETPAAPAAAAPTNVAPATVAPASVARTTAATPATKPAAVASAPVKPAPAKPAVAEEAHPQAAAHAPMVQLAALSSEEAAHTEWALLVKKMPDLLSGKQPNYTRVEHDGHSFWRVRTSGFGDVAQARGFCDRVRAKGAGCSVADF